MSRILLSAYACEPGKGSEPEVGWLWATELAAAGHEVWVLTRMANRAAIEARTAQHPIPRLHFEYYDLPRWIMRRKRGALGVYWYYALWQWGAYRTARKLAERVQFDRVQHVTFVGVRAPSFMGRLGLPFVLGPVSGGERVPQELRSGMPGQARRMERLRDAANRLARVEPIMRQSFQQAERILVATEASRELLPPALQHKCEVHLGIGLSREYLGWSGQRNASTERPLRLLYAGRLLPWKGVHLALRALAAATDRSDQLRFTIAGDGPARERLEQLAVELGLGEQVRWVRWLPHDELEELYRKHDALLFPSLRDSGGMTVLEAMAHGLPVICTDLGGPGAIVNDRCGRVVSTAARSEEEVVAALADAVCELDGDRVLLRKLGRAARARAWDFDFRRVVTRVHPVEIGATEQGSTARAEEADERLLFRYGKEPQGLKPSVL
jgi:glycosyltransferase involved in cell wall biosynthesis